MESAKPWKSVLRTKFCLESAKENKNRTMDQFSISEIMLSLLSLYIFITNTNIPNMISNDLKAGPQLGSSKSDQIKSGTQDQTLMMVGTIAIAPPWQCDTGDTGAEI